MIDLPALDAAASVVSAVRIWVWIGLGVSAVFLLWGIDRVEPNARGAWTFRVLLVPGIVLLWPLVLWRWAVLETGRDRPLARHRAVRAWHGAIWWGMALAIPAILIAGMLARPDLPLDAPAVKLSEAGQ